MKQRSLLLPLLFAGLSAVGQEPVPTAIDSNAVKTLFFAGLREKLNENYAKASENFNKVLSIDPQNAAVHYELANLSYRQNKLNEAEMSIKKSVALDANNSWYWKLLAELYKRKGDMESLVPVFNQLIRLSPEEDAYYFDRSNAYALMGNREEALKGYDELEKKFGPSAALTQARQRLSPDMAKAPTKKELDKILADGQTDGKGLLDISETLMQKGQFGEALTVLQKAKGLDADNYEIDLALADNYKGIKNTEAAKEAVKAAFLNPSMPTEQKVKIIMMLASGNKNQERLQEAAELTEITLKQEPSDPKLLALYGDVLFQQGNLRGALGQYQAALKVAEDMYGAWEQILNIQTSLGQYKEAVKTADEALSIYPNQAVLYYYMAFALHRDNQNAQAMVHVKSALQLEPDDKALLSMIFALQGEILIDEQKFAEANTAFDKAVSLAPDNYLVLNNYAYYLALRNLQLPKAESLIATAAKAMPNNSSIADTYAFILMKLEKYELAKSWIEKALKNNSAKDGVYLERYGDILYLKGEKEQGLIQWQKAREAGNQTEKLIRKINEKKYIK